MDFPTFLLTVTIIVVALVVVEKLAGGLQKIVDDTAPLESHLTTVNGALGQLNGGLESVDNHLVATAKVFNL